MNAKANRRRRGAQVGLLLLLLALGGYGYAQSSSPSASTGSSSGPSSSQVLAPAASGANANGSNASCTDPSSGSGSCDHSVGVTVGQTQTLYPGLNRSVPVTFSNSNSFDILVTSYKVSVAVPASKAATCPASNLQVPTGTVTLNPKLVVPKKGSVATTVPIKLLANAPGACQQVTFTITVNASAVKK
jgi:hypothetical protein